MRKPFLIALLMLALWPAGHAALAQSRAGWSTPHRLSDTNNISSEASLVADDFGFVHAFWREELPDTSSLLQYARYDGDAWSTPVDIRVHPPLLGPKSMSAVVDDAGMMHLAWIIGANGPAIYSKAPAHEANSAQNWIKGRPIKVPANSLQLAVTDDGTLHVLFQVTLPDQIRPGIYYTRSTDEGWTWSDPAWLDPDIPPKFVPRRLQFARDVDNTLHAVWNYVSTIGSDGDWVRYARSTDDGLTWEVPLTLAKNDQGDLLNTFASPTMAVSGRSVHIIWAGGDLLYRNHRYSVDGGATWSNKTRVFDDLNGQAFDGMTVDGAGRVHFLGQIRFPMAIYHAVWDNGAWTRPEPIYQIRLTSDDPYPPGIIQAHHVHPVVQGGNKLVVTFADPPPEPKRQLYVVQKELDDVVRAAVHPTPSPPPTATPEPPDPTPAPTPEPTPARFPPVTENTVLFGLSRTPENAIGLAGLAVAGLAGFILVIRMLWGIRR